MRNRWYHKAELHTSEKGEKKVSWLELFFDLIFVAAFIQLGDALSGNVSLVSFLKFVASFIPLWLVWLSFSYYLNRFNLDDFLHRCTVFLLMFSVGGMALGAGSVFDNNIIKFALPTGLSFLIVSLMYLRAYLEEPESRQYSKYWGGVIFSSSVIWFVSTLFPANVAQVLWGIATFIVLISPLMKVSRDLNIKFATDFEHLSERFGLLTLIVLGESFVKVLSVLSSNGINALTAIQSCIVLLITCSIWWVYFDDVAGSKVKEKPLAIFFWLYGHFPLQLGITATGVAIKKALFFDPGAVAPYKYRWLLCGVLTIVLLSVALVDSVTKRKNTNLSDRVRINFRFGSAIIMLLLAPVGYSMPAWFLLLLVMLVMVAQVVFDMLIAPTEEVTEHHGVKTTAELLKENPDYAKKLKRFDFKSSLVKGAPSELKKDFYFFLIEGSWKKFTLTVTFIFFMANVLFAALYMLDASSITGVREGNFFDAFSFSVQTMSTIGFGSMSPASDYGHIVMICEAVFSIVFVAFCTGVTFAKASKPKSDLLFSNNILINRFDGKDVLMFRAGNTRGSQVMEATATMHVLVDKVTEEGQMIRSFEKVSLLKNQSPIFSLTWSLYHEITEDSPLYPVLKEKDPYKVFAVIVNINGHDSVYGQNIYTSNMYYPENIVFDKYFEDIIHQTEEGRFLVDYDKFNLLKA